MWSPALPSSQRSRVSPRRSPGIRSRRTGWGSRSRAGARPRRHRSLRRGRCADRAGGDSMRIWALVSVAWSPDCGRREPGVSRAAAIYAGFVSWESEGGRGVDGRAQGRVWRCRASCAGCTRGSAGGRNLTLTTWSLYVPPRTVKPSCRVQRRRKGAKRGNKKRRFYAVERRGARDVRKFEMFKPGCY